MKLIITSPMRVGSRWLTELLADLFQMNTQPEIDDINFDGQIKNVHRNLNNNIIVKFHGSSVEKILNTFKYDDLHIISIVRNPRDRAVSLAFHYRNHKWEKHHQKDVETDFDAVKYTVMKEPMFKDRNKLMFDLMKLGYSTHCKKFSDMPYIWTSYEWLLLDTRRELKAISKFLGEPYQHYKTLKAIHNSSFEIKTRRKLGEENRRDMWRRKGIMGDWENWFDEPMINATQKDYDEYYKKLDQEDKSC
jgi:hypothetical protein